MGFLKRLADALFSTGDRTDPYGMHFYVQCDRCGAVVDARVDRRNDLSRQYGGDSTFIWRKGILDDRCFRPMQAEIHFDERYRVVSKDVTGGHFVTQEQYLQLKGE